MTSAAIYLLATVASIATPPTGIRATGDDAAIRLLLREYSSAVTRKDEPTFEALLLSKDIPFSPVAAAPTETGAAGWRNYEDFRRSVFEGAPFSQTFRDVHVRRHGALADVDLVYVNKVGGGVHEGWKTMQLLKVGGAWKIASEFFTALPDGRQR